MTRLDRRRLVGAGLVGLAGCLTANDGDGGTATDTTGDGTPSFRLRSGAFDPGASIPPEFTCAGADVSPPLRIAGVPDDAETLALVVDDPDAPGGSFVHWLVWNVPRDTTTIPREVPTTDRVDALGGAPQGANEFGTVGYRGPCPPTGDDPHTYRFTLAAVAGTLDLEPGASRDTLSEALRDRVVSRARLTGTFGRDG